jgi:pyruvate,water dikinase
MESLISRLKMRVKQWRSSGNKVSRDQVSRIFRFRYACFKDLLSSNTEILNIISEFEDKLRGQDIFGMSYVRSQATRAVFHCLRMAKSLDDLSHHRYPMLFPVVDRLNQAIKEELGKRRDLALTEYVMSYSSITKEMVDWVGGKNANLGELLNRTHLPIPRGFAITTRAYEYFIDSNGLYEEINRLRRNLLIDRGDPSLTESVSESIQSLICASPIPDDLADAVLAAYDELARGGASTDDSQCPELKVAMRSSAIGEDSELSYAGQYLSLLNVPRKKLLDAYKQIISSLFSSRALSYRLNKGIRDEDIAMSVACIEMIDSVASGVMYSRHPFHLDENCVLINAVWGLGPYAVDGVVTPDTYALTKEESPKMPPPVVSYKPVKLVAGEREGVEEKEVAAEQRNEPCLTPEQAITLARYAMKLESHYAYPQDIEWAIHPDGRILVLQTRPLHLEEFEQDGVKTFPRLEKYPLVLEGAAVAVPGVGSGPVFLVDSDEDLINFPEGSILVSRHSSPQFVIVMRKARAIVTEAGSVTGHMASLAREFGVPTILDAKSAISLLKEDTTVTVDAYSGRIYEGVVPELVSLQRTRESAMKDTPVFQTLKKVAAYITPLNLVDPKAENFRPEACKTIHDVTRLVHELSYQEMFAISDVVSDTDGGGALKLVAPIPLDLRIIDLGGGLSGVSAYTKQVTVDKVTSVPFNALLTGMLCEDLRSVGPRPIDFGGFFSVIREQMVNPKVLSERFGDRSYAIIADKYLNFSSRIGYHYSVLDSYCGETVNKNYISFSFKGGAADEIRRNRRARAIAIIFESLGFMVDVREDRLTARYYKFEKLIIESKLEMIGRMLQFTRQMDMLMHSEASVEILAKNFLAGNYQLDGTISAEAS